MALTKPILYSQSAFDATQSHQFTFNVIGGDQVVKNRLTIINQITNQVVYNQTQTTYTFAHNLPANVLTNGVYYSAYITTFNYSDEESAPSISIQFYCYSKPSFIFSNIPASGIINNATYDFQLTYNQEQGEKLSSYIVYLYDAQKIEIVNSGVKYAGVGIVPMYLYYTLSGLNDGVGYYLRATGVTVEGTQIDTGYISITVTYSQPNIFSIVELSNNCTGGYVLVKSNLSAINGESVPYPPVYINGSIDMRSKESYIEWNKGYNITGNFTASLWGRNFNDNSTIIKLENQDGDTITVNYAKNLDGSYYTELIVNNLNSGLTYYIYSENIEILDIDTNLQIWFRKIGNLYEISLRIATDSSTSYFSLDEDFEEGTEI